MESFRRPILSKALILIDNYPAGFDTTELRDLKRYSTSFHNVSENIMQRKDIMVVQESVWENDKEYKYCYIPIKSTLRLFLSNEIAM